jgi:hypothetical protein
VVQEDAMSYADPAAQSSRRRAVRGILWTVPVLALLLGGCINTPFGARSEPRRLQEGLFWKQVFDKSPPAYLIAVDRTVCTVSAERFNQVRVGQRVLCDWKSNGIVATQPRLGASATQAPTASPAEGAARRRTPVQWPQPVARPAPGKN